MARKKLRIRIRRVYEAPGPDEGYRALVDRLWPRGLKRTPDLFAEWAKDAAPSPELRRWYGHDPARFEAFSARYRAELAEPPGREAVSRLAARAERAPLTLLTATKDVELSAAKVLAGVIDEVVTGVHQEDDRAGDPACLAHLICPYCGGVLSEGHQPGCRSRGSTG